MAFAISLKNSIIDLCIFFRCSRGIPWEVCLKLIGLTFGMVGEYITALDENWNLVHTHNLQVGRQLNPGQLKP